MKTSSMLDLARSEPTTLLSGQPQELFWVEGQIEKQEPATPECKPEIGGVVINLPQFAPLEHRPTEFFAAIQEWEGVVTSVSPEGFTADLYDITAGKDEVSEVAEISFDDIDPADRHRVIEGAIFRWLIGHSRTRSGQTSRKWVFYFRRAPKMKICDSPLMKVKVPDHIRAQLPKVVV